MNRLIALSNTVLGARRYRATFFTCQALHDEQMVVRWEESTYLCFHGQDGFGFPAVGAWL